MGEPPTKAPDTKQTQRDADVHGRGCKVPVGNICDQENQAADKERQHHKLGQGPPRPALGFQGGKLIKPMRQIFIEGIFAVWGRHFTDLSQLEGPRRAKRERRQAPRAKAGMNVFR